MKKLLAVLFSVLFLFALCVDVRAESNVCELRLEQYDANVPNINVFFYPADSDGVPIDDFLFEKNEVEAYLDDQSLSVSDIFRGADVDTTYVLVVDISGSVGKEYFENAKRTMVKLVEGLGSNRLLLLTMGDDVKTLLDGNESKETAIAAIEGLKLETNQEGTNYYEAINKAIDKAEKLNAERCVVVTVSDGMNTKESSYNKEDTLERMRNAKLSMHSIGIGRKDNCIALDDLMRFTEATNGFYFPISADEKNNQESVDAVFNKCFATIDSCIGICLKTDSNAVSGNTLQIKISNSNGVNTLTITNFTVDSWQVDDEAPYIVSTEIVNANEVRIVFSEQMLLADTVSNYSIKDSEDRAIGILGVTYDKTTFTVTLSLHEDIYDGEYRIECFNLTDASKQRNPLNITDNMSFVQTGHPCPAEEQIQAGNWILYVIAAVVLFMLVVILVVVIIKRKKTAEEEKRIEEQARVDAMDSIGQEKVRLNNIDGCNITISIVERNGLCRTLPMFIAKSCIVGRSSAECDCSIDDPRMSRQHFAICYSGGTLTIEDLNSTNGTTLNGVPLRDRRPLRKNDVIIAGNTKIIVEE